MGIIHVGKNMLIHIIDRRAPKGRFWTRDNGRFVGVDNSTGEAWTEEFDTKEACFDYLGGAADEE